jgi:hypothetical protein
MKRVWKELMGDEKAGALAGTVLTNRVNNILEVRELCVCRDNRNSMIC